MGVPVCWICHMHPIKIYSNIRFQNISSWSDICNICLAFWTECGRNSSTSFSKIGLSVIKRQESTRLQTFLFCVVQIEIASPTACDQGQNLSRGFMSVLGAPLNLYNWYLKKNMSNILLYSSQTYKIHLWIFRLHDIQQKYFLRCYSATWDLYSENDQPKVWKLKSKPRLEGMLFGFP